MRFINIRGNFSDSSVWCTPPGTVHIAATGATSDGWTTADATPRCSWTGCGSKCPGRRTDMLDDEDRIVWLKDPRDYAYLREGDCLCGGRVRFPLKGMDPAAHTDGGSLAHIVAYATLKAGTRVGCGWFKRRYWWVKSYDRFNGHGFARNFRGQGSGYYDHGAPAEAVMVDSVVAGVISIPYREGK